MNANELADEFDKFSTLAYKIEYIKFFKEAATMLRQQQAEIIALKDKLCLWEEFGRQVVGHTSNEGTR